MAGDKKKTSGGIRPKGGKAAGQGANTCKTERQPYKSATARKQGFSLAKGNTLLPAAAKKQGQREGKGDARKGERVPQGGRGSPFGFKVSGAGKTCVKNKSNSRKEIKK